jgi:hypothetical protein
MKNLLNILLFVIVVTSISFAQTGQKWKPLIISDSTKVWYDLLQLDSVSTSKFEIWLLELYKPTIQIDGINEKVSRAKTLYIINLDKLIYGIKEAVYYNINNEEIRRFAYPIDQYEEDKKYIFPILPNTIIDKTIKELISLKEKKKK